MRIFSLALVAFISLACGLQAELPPSAYEDMQAKAPEHLEIEVIQISTSSDAETNAQIVEAVARVAKVYKSQTKLGVDDIIRIHYKIHDRTANEVGPGEVPLLEENHTTVAYLRPPDSGDMYSPAAGRMSFSNF